MTNALKNIKALIPQIQATDPFRNAWVNIADKEDFHPAVLNVLKKYEPVNWVELLFEHPYVSADGERIAYLSEQRSFKRDGSVMPLVTNTPRYLARHFPYLKDHELRDLATYTDGCSYKLLDDIHEIIWTIDTAKIWSCMQSSYHYSWIRPWQLQAYKAHGTEFDVDPHPYAAYCPSLGWKLAVRYAEDGEIAARALVFEKVFVRSYQADGSKGNKADPQLNAWMEAQGFRQEDGWERGTPLKRRDPMVFPYIDGDYQNVNDDFEITYRGGYLCNKTDGTADGYSNGEACGDCGDRMSEDESHYVSDRGHNVCGCCIENYTYIEGDGEYIDNDHVGRVGDIFFDTRCSLPDGIVQLEDGDYAEADDCVCIDGDWYLENDRQVVELEEEHDGDTHGLKSDCWQADGRWFHDDVESVKIDGTFYVLSECATDDITSEVYTPGTEMLDLPCGKTVHPDSEAAKQLELT
jgi:hypothetical protein